MPLTPDQVAKIHTDQIPEKEPRVNVYPDHVRGDPIAALPPLERMEAIKLKAMVEMTETLTKRSKELIEREIAIGMGEARDDKGKAPDFMVQAITLKSLRQQVMGSPTQRIEQKSQSLVLKATYDLPSERIDRDTQPDKTRIPDSLTAQLTPKEIKAIMATKPDHGIDQWKRIADSGVHQPIPDVGSGPMPRQEPTPMDKKSG